MIKSWHTRTYVRLYIRIIWLFFYIYPCVLYPDTINKEHVFTQDHIKNDQIIDQLVTQPFIADALTFDVDLPLQKVEFLYLMGISEGQEVTADILKKAVRSLVKKNIFNQIRMSLTPGIQGYTIHTKLEGLWTFQAVMFHGILVGSERYHRYYHLEPGDPFDQQQHALSLKQMREALAQEGYWDVQIDSRIVRDPDTKLVIVHITINQGQRYTIDDVILVAQGHDEIQEKVADTFLNNLIGDYYSHIEITQHTKKAADYLSRAGFLDSSIQLSQKVNNQDRTVTLSFIIDFDKQRNFLFVGNTIITDQQLFERLMLFGRSTSMLPELLLADELVDAYKEKGFWSVFIKAEEKDNQTVFDIAEGPRVFIESVEIKGTVSFDVQWLIKRYFQDVKKNYYDIQVIQQALNSLVGWYVSQGWWDARIKEYTFQKKEHGDNNLLNNTIDNDMCAYTLTMIIDEGEQSILTGVTIVSSTGEPYIDLEKQEIFKSVSTQHKLMPFTSQVMAQQERWLINWFQGQGYLYVNVEPEIIRDKKNVSLRWHINPGLQTVFGKTIVQGAMTFPFDILMEELTYKPGDPWNKEAIKKSLSNLRSLGAFESIQLSPDDVVISEHEKTMLLRVQKSERCELRARLGFELDQLSSYVPFGGVAYRAGGAFICKNPFNRADLVTLDADSSRAHRTCSMRYERPWLARLPVRGIGQVYAHRYEYPGYFGSTKNLYGVYQEGLICTIRRMHQVFESGLTCGFEWVKTVICDSDKSNGCKRYCNKEEIDCIARALHFDLSLVDKKIPYAVIEPTLYIDNLDNKVNPHYGGLTLLSLKGSFPIGGIAQSSYFIKLLCDQSLFYSFGTAPVTVAFRLRFGHIFHRNFCRIMPIDRFYLGGSHSIRSYQTDRCPPLGTVSDQCGTCHLVPQGGKTVAHSTLELRFPVYSTSVMGAIFHDIGTLIGSGSHTIDDKKLLSGTGFGIRYLTPLGPFRGDIAWKWRRDLPWQQQCAWFITFGHPF